MDGEQLGLIWRHIPPELVAAQIGIGSPDRVPVQVFGRKHWDAILEKACADRSFWIPVPLQHVDPTALIEACKKGLREFDHRSAWASDAGALLAAIPEILEVNAYAGKRLIFCAPDELTERLLAVVEPLLSGPHDRSLRIWLHELIERRAPAWRRAYALRYPASPALAG